VHAVAEVHETPDRMLLPETLSGEGVRSVDHELPFQPSASVAGMFLHHLVPPLFTQYGKVRYPTAVHDACEAHATPDSAPPFAPAGRGMGWVVDHALPFHDSASGAPLLWPTAMQPAAAHDTPDRELLVAPAGFGVVWIDQELPSHRSARVGVRFAPELMMT
jgi:hypothetical protein